MPTRWKLCKVLRKPTIWCWLSTHWWSCIQQLANLPNKELIFLLCMHIIASCLVDAIFHANPIYNMNQVFGNTLAKRRNKRRSICHLLLSAPILPIDFLLMGEDRFGQGRKCYCCWRAKTLAQRAEKASIGFAKVGPWSHQGPWTILEQPNVTMLTEAHVPTTFEYSKAVDFDPAAILLVWKLPVDFDKQH